MVFNTDSICGVSVPDGRCCVRTCVARVTATRDAVAKKRMPRFYATEITETYLTTKATKGRTATRPRRWADGFGWRVVRRAAEGGSACCAGRPSNDLRA